jgi:NAD(P)-dependent dehydrogenase (short-subunit alcohol dehydrogenase family)
MDLELKGKSVVICGGARGIGFACAEAFAREGARVAIFDWNKDARGCAIRKCRL